MEAGEQRTQHSSWNRLGLPAKQQMQHVAGKDTERRTKGEGEDDKRHMHFLPHFLFLLLFSPPCALRVLVNLLRANVNSGTCSQVRLATGCLAPAALSCHCCESCPKMNECSPRPVGNKNVVVAKQRRGYSPCHLSLCRLPPLPLLHAATFSMQRFVNR